MVDQAVKDGQLNECDLSLKDLTDVKEALARTLASHYHGRIEYPDASQLAPSRKAKVTRLVKNA